MPANVTSAAPVIASIPSSQDALVAMIIGVAIFDHSGLPQEYFITPENPNTNWVQLVFQSLGLKSLLMSSLKLDGFQHLLIGINNQMAIVVRTKDAYVALLFKERYQFTTTKTADQFSQWVRQFESQQLRQHERFSLA